MFCVSPMNWRAGLVHCKYSQCLISTDAPLQGEGCRSLGCVSLNVPFLCLQRRLREAVQLLEDYKHGTLRPGVTNEQVTLLEVGREGKVANSPPPPSLQPEPLLFPSESTSTAATSLVDFWLFGRDIQVSPVTWVW